MAREAFVQESVIGADKFEDATVFANDIIEEEFGLFFHGGAQRFVELRIFFFGRRGGAEVANLQPLAGEVVDERAGFWIFEHPLDLNIEIFAKGAAGSLREEFVVGHAAPEEMGKARGEREFVKRMDGTRIVGIGLSLAAEQKLRRDKNRLERELDTGLEILAGIAAHLIEFHEAIDFAPVNGPAIGAAREVLDDLASGEIFSAGHGVSHEDASMRFGWSDWLDRGRAADFKVVDDEVAVAPTLRVFGIVVIVQVRSGELAFARAKRKTHLVDLGTFAHDRNVEAADLLIVQEESHTSRFGSRLLAVSAHPQRVFAVGLEVEMDVNVAFAAKPAHALVGSVARRGTI